MARIEYTICDVCETKIENFDPKVNIIATPDFVWDICKNCLIQLHILLIEERKRNKQLR